MTRLPHNLALLLALAFAPACIVGVSTTATGGSDTSEFVCDDPNSYLDGENCYCNPGYDFCTADPDDLSCCPVSDTTTSQPETTTHEPEPTTTDGTTTLLPPTSSTTTDGTTETTTEGVTETDGTTDEPSTTTTTPEECLGAQPPPDECNNGQFWCTMPEVCGPEGSEIYRCEGAVWALEPNLAKDACNFDGYDFSYGCVDTGKNIEFICGDGPGTTCDDSEPTSCASDTDLAQCLYGKLTHFDCLVQCTEVGDDMGALYDHGFCGDDRGASVCLCCDAGEPGCPI